MCMARNAAARPSSQPFCNGCGRMVVNAEQMALWRYAACRRATHTDHPTQTVGPGVGLKQKNSDIYDDLRMPPLWRPRWPGGNVSASGPEVRPDSIELVWYTLNPLGPNVLLLVWSGSVEIGCLVI
ncbi:hypothetical protein AVEN_66534-1 [Araneus ventricosus]|uniref:Uncharacterized protein n=1 Tax=Araneus ventricosus TaxID=182803 RepID=A0A4Y2EAZ7_ARAVE|nr:hypothetical protein AVEN_66534-1 [Araneus ventricosus]